MAFTYGFYNYDKNDGDSKLYDAQQMSQLFDGIITDGVYAHVGHKLAVTTERAGKAVKVESGRAWFNHTWNYNDSNLVLDLLGYPSSNRIDAVVIDINANKNSRTNKIMWVRGEEASNPQRPSLIHDELHNQYALAYVTRRQGQATISQADISNVVGTTETPYVTGILQQVDASQILSNFEAAYAQFEIDKNAEFQSFLSQESSAFQSYLGEKDLAFNDQMDDLIENFEDFIGRSLIEFNEFMNDRTIDVNRLLENFQSEFSSEVTSMTAEFGSFMTASQNRFDTFMAGLEAQCNEKIRYYALVAEGYANGTQNGSEVGSGSPYYRKSARYFATQASNSASAATVKSTQAATSATSASESASVARSKASEAADSANRASTKAGEASTSASTAATKATEAAMSAATASNGASVATGKANDAATSATLAQSYTKGGTNTRSGEDTDNARHYYNIAKTYAENAANSASNAAISAERAEIAASHPPYIGPNGNWFIWDVNAGGFVDSGIDASITVDIADITMLPYGEDPSVTNTGTNTDPVFHLSIPNAKSAYLSAKDGGYTGTEEQFNSYLVNLQSYATSAANSANTATSKASESSTSATNAANSAKLAESYTKGGTGTRTGENTDNTLYYKNLAKTYAENAEAVVGIGIATVSKAGIVKPDGETIFVDEGGKITAGISDNDWATLTQLFQ